MVKTERTWQCLGVTLVFALGLGIGWAGATYRAIDEARARDGSGFDETFKRLEMEEMRRLDLSETQRREFLAARDEAKQEIRRVLGRYRPEVDAIIHRADAKIRPTLSPRQLALYDNLEQERQEQMPVRPIGADD
jgi:Spy/CpxP family protein refolding chaperone